MRGWPATSVDDKNYTEVFPAHAGMARVHGLQFHLAIRVPRACGDGPGAAPAPTTAGWCSPRMRGWPAGSSPGNWEPRVFPAHAGMARHHREWARCIRGVPRACGDGPSQLPERCSLGLCSPRMRGWPAVQAGDMIPSQVFPAHAGMARFIVICAHANACVPRACGDGPPPTTWTMGKWWCSPRMRGWPGGARVMLWLRAVFPAHAGMAQRNTSAAAICARVPRACGDGPLRRVLDGTFYECSPRMRGWPGRAGA